MEKDDINKKKVVIESCDFLMKETDITIDKYNKCKTAYEKVKLIPKLEHLRDRLVFEKRLLEKIINEE